MNPLHRPDDSITRSDYEAIRRADEEKIREALAEPSEAERQKREYIEANRRRGSQ